MARKQLKQAKTGRTVLVVDDNLEYLASAEMLLAREGHTVIAVSNPVEALELLRRQHVDLVLVDFFMPEMTGEDLVRELRTFNPVVQVILQTGYASEQPPRELLKRLDIQGYYDKGDGPDKLLLWADVGLKAAFTVQLLEKSRLGLRYILNATPALHKLQPLSDLLQGILVQMTGLLGAVDAFVAVLADRPREAEIGPPQALLTIAGEASDLIVRAGTGRFLPSEPVEECLSPDGVTALRRALGSGAVTVTEAGSALPLRVGELPLGAVFIDRPLSEPRDVELLEIFANQAAVAIHNAQLYELAALDPLTGAYTRGFFRAALAREIRSAHRNARPLSILMVDVDHMKEINDRGGHLAGDEALQKVGRVLRHSTRGTDSVGRYGGDELVVLLPGTNAEGAAATTERILGEMSGCAVTSPEGLIDVRVSIGCATLSPPSAEVGRGPASVRSDMLSKIAQDLYRCADESLYSAKTAGRGRAGAQRTLEWPGPVSRGAGGPSHSGRSRPSRTEGPTSSHRDKERAA